MASDPLAPFRLDPASSAILLDVDGTLAPIVDHPDFSAVLPSTLEVIERLVERYGLVACVSGRAAIDAARLVPVAGVRFVGNHGLVLHHAPGVEEWMPIVASAARAIAPIAAEVGAWVEDKGATLSVHLREAPDPTRAHEVLVARAVPLINAAGLGWRWGRMTLEARPPLEQDKGTAVQHLLAEHPTIVRSLYAGDDQTDLDAFGVVDVAIAVASDEAPAELGAAAVLTVDGPAGLATLLESLANSE